MPQLQRLVQELQRISVLIGRAKVTAKRTRLTDLDVRGIVMRVRLSMAQTLQPAQLVTPAVRGIQRHVWDLETNLPAKLRTILMVDLVLGLCVLVIRILALALGQAVLGTHLVALILMEIKDLARGPADALGTQQIVMFTTIITLPVLARWGVRGAQ